VSKAPTLTPLAARGRGAIEEVEDRGQSQGVQGQTQEGKQRRKLKRQKPSWRKACFSLLVL
jgi:hypothetical protein